MSAKRILFINDYKSGGGAEVVLHQLMGGLKETGVQAELFYGLEINQSKKGNPLSYIYSRYYKKKLAGVLREFNPDIIHLLNYYHILSPSVLDAVRHYKRNNSSVRVIYTAHDFHLLCPNSGLTSFSIFSNRIKRENPVKHTRGLRKITLLFKKWDHRGVFYSMLKVLQWSIAYTVRNSWVVIDTVVTPGRFMFSVMKKEFPEKNVVLIRNPYIPPEADSNIKSSSGLAADLKGGSKKRVRLVFAGRIAQEKGLVPFIEGVSGENWNKIELHVFGEGPQLGELKGILTRIGKEDRCYFYGAKPHGEILGILNKFNVLLLPSLLFENAPLSIVEAAFSGLRIMASDWGGIKALSEFCGGEYLFNPENPESINNSLGKIISDMKAEESGNQNIETLKEVFSFETFINSHLSIYKLL